MFYLLRRLAILFLIACLPLQGFAMQAGQLAHDSMTHSQMDHHGGGGDHGCCPHDSPAADDQQPPHKTAGDCSHCPLCSVTPAASLVVPYALDADASLHPAPERRLSTFYPELPQRPPLAPRA